MRATVDARALFQKLVETRLATGEPYIVFSDTVNRMMPKHHRDLGLKVSTSNLCSEITLPTGNDHLGNDRTAVCCLSLAQPRDLGRVERRQAASSRTSCASSTMCCRTISTARRAEMARAKYSRRCANARSASA